MSGAFREGVSQVFAEDGTGQLVPLRPAAPAAGLELEGLLDTHAELIAGSGGPLLMLARRVGPMGSPGTLPCRLLVGRDAVAVLVAVVPPGEGRGGRALVAELLDLAANGLAFWPPGTLEAAFRAEAGTRAAETETEFLGDEADGAGFWAQADANLAAGRFRLVLAAEAIPADTARLIEFLNDQMHASVLGVELRFFSAGEGRRVLIPQRVGETARSRAAWADRSDDMPRPAAPVTPETWIADTISPLGLDAQTVARAWLKLARDLRGRPVLTRGGTLQVLFDVPGVGAVAPVDLDARARIELRMREFARTSAFRDPGDRQDWLDRLWTGIGALTRVRADGYPRLRAAALADPGRWDAFAALVREMVARMNVTRLR